MNSFLPKSPQKICEALLTEEKLYNNEHHIWPSQNAVVDRLLARGIELQEAYEELCGKLNSYPQALKLFFELVLSTAVQCSPKKVQKARSARNALVIVNQQIEKKAAELAALLKQRSELNNTSGFCSSTHYHVCDVLEAAAQQNQLFQSFVQEKLGSLSCQFDLKYWPSLSDFLDVLASDAEKAVIEATDPLTYAATESTRPSKADFFRALFAAIEENSAECFGQLPKGFKLTDRTLASLGNCALGLGPDDLVDEAYMKRLRQRGRDERK